MADKKVRRVSNPADRVVRARLKEQIHFPDLTERMALKLSAVPHYTARAHFGLWHRVMGRPNFEEFTGVFTPLFFVDVETADVPLDPARPLRVRGETFLARTLDETGAVDHIVRVGEHEVLVEDGTSPPRLAARARLLNVFTRYDPDPARRRVTKIPPEMGLGTLPSRVWKLPTLNGIAPVQRDPDDLEKRGGVWHYGQTDPNRHVNGMEYLYCMEDYIADFLERQGRDLRRLYFSRARILYRKPCFRGERYRRAAWVCSEDPLTVTGGFFKQDDSPAARPAVAIQFTISQHPA